MQMSLIRIRIGIRIGIGRVGGGRWGTQPLECIGVFIFIYPVYTGAEILTF